MQGTTANPLRSGPARTMPYTSPSAQMGSGNDYKLGRRLDRGGPDEVYEAFHASQPGRLAIKLVRRALTVPPQAAEAFKRETSLVARLRHPHIVQIVEIGRLAVGIHFVVMEFLPGQTLRAHLGRRGPVPAVEAVGWLKALAGALSAGHGVGAVHGGLRPSKVFLMEAAGYERGFVKILDFGSWHLGMGNGRGPDGEVAAYTAPELAQAVGVGRPEVLDPAADQFSLAAIAYRLLAGRDVAAGAPRPLSSICACDPMVESVVMRGLARHPRERWESVQAFVSGFEQAALSALPVLTQTVSRNQIMAASTIEVREDVRQDARAQLAEEDRPTPPPRTVPQPLPQHVPQTVPVRATPSRPAPAASVGAQVEDELTDELSQKFFAEGDAQSASAQAGTLYPGPHGHPSTRKVTGFEPTAMAPTGQAPHTTRAPAHTTGRSPAQPRRYQRPPDEDDQDLQISLEKLVRVPRRRWPGRLLLFVLLAGGAAAYWRSELPYAAEARAWVGQHVPLPELLTR